MEKLIVKGGFRERANRQRKYQNSENQQTTLQPHRYTVTDQAPATPSKTETAESETKSEQ
ncbi:MULTISPECIES: hypothetical protein [unclassified Acinetobacter]|uniref:hypothetical protein n=1 Tax=unclassified Acinetobacter TaxID=196816 RepID=UPI0002CEF926|nr:MULTISPECIES: hypothetical protein [unclassified Acinetobacter]ENU80056.1 hypothetical protein F975_01808 [Acinetobacter sp. ANC 3789]PVZ90018.1 hypothetical protein C9426_01140 [Serratia sp. S1B]TCB31881.1 hypothetical protein E0H86_05520 [Acinetobacter sp. ANC 4635]